MGTASPSRRNKRSVGRGPSETWDQLAYVEDLRELIHLPLSAEEHLSPGQEFREKTSSTPDIHLVAVPITSEEELGGPVPERHHARRIGTCSFGGAERRRSLMSRSHGGVRPMQWRAGHSRPTVPSCSFRANPKSASRTSPLLEMRMFAGLISR